jgi:mono/diheme cytochrome c family protein
MPPFAQFTADQIWQVLAYIRRLSGTSTSDAVPSDPVAGLAIFDGTGGCRTCHQDDLRGTGLMTAQQLRSAIVNPGQQPIIDILTQEGREYRGPSQE